MNEAAHAPFQDFNIVRSQIPVVLLEAVADPYARPQPVTCEALSADLAKLDDALGPDFDVPKAPRSNMDKSASFAAGAGAKAMKDLTEGWIPMRNWVRYMTGRRAALHGRAERHLRRQGPPRLPQGPGAIRGLRRPGPRPAGLSVPCPASHAVERRGELAAECGAAGSDPSGRFLASSGKREAHLACCRIKSIKARSR